MAQKKLPIVGFLGLIESCAVNEMNIAKNKQINKQTIKQTSEQTKMKNSNKEIFCSLQFP